MIEPNLRNLFDHGKHTLPRTTRLLAHKIFQLIRLRLQINHYDKDATFTNKSSRHGGTAIVHAKHNRGAIMVAQLGPPAYSSAAWAKSMIVSLGHSIWRHLLTDVSS